MIDLNNVHENDLIPNGTIAKAVISIKPGGSERNVFLTRSKNGENYYLDCTFTICEGEFTKRKIFHKIGVEGSSEIYVNQGLRLIRNILESARGIKKNDKSEQAERARRINSWEDLNGLTTTVKIGIDDNGEYPAKNKIIDAVPAPVEEVPFF